MSDVLIIIVIIESIVLYFLFKQYKELKFSKKSYEVKTGKWLEYHFPYMKDYPVDYKTVRFLGEPIDAVAFDIEKGIFFIEHKTGSSQLSEKQKQIKKLVEDGKIYWKEVRIS